MLSDEVIDKSEEVFNALSERSRLQILHLLLTEGEKSIGEVADSVSWISRSLVGRNLLTLKYAGLVKIRRAGRSKMCSASPELKKTLKAVFAEIGIRL